MKTSEGKNARRKTTITLRNNSTLAIVNTSQGNKRDVISGPRKNNLVLNSSQRFFPNIKLPRSPQNIQYTIYTPDSTRKAQFKEAFPRQYSYLAEEINSLKVTIGALTEENEALKNTFEYLKREVRVDIHKYSTLEVEAQKSTMREGI